MERIVSYHQKGLVLQRCHHTGEDTWCSTGPQGETKRVIEPTFPKQAEQAPPNPEFVNGEPKHEVLAEKVPGQNEVPSPFERITDGSSLSAVWLHV